ncbi:MAG TPA: cytochrome c peroxidase [Pirellulaceae bacterium]|nr:cytochrome c peroxidase [Pirellulaceae bacterium]
MQLKYSKEVLCMVVICCDFFSCRATHAGDASLDERLDQALKVHGFPADLNTLLDRKLGRKIETDPERLTPMAALGRDLFFDKVLSLANDNSCAGCHSPKDGFGDTQSIAIGVSNNNLVGPNRKGPRNQRRTPMALNNAFYPKLMWNGRFAAISGDPFDNSKGFEFPPPEGEGDEQNRRFPAGDKHITHLLSAQAQIPSTELPEMAGFRLEPESEPSDGIPRTFREPRFDGREFEIVPIAKQVRELKGMREHWGNPVSETEPEVLPHGLGGFFNEPIRGVVLLRLNAIDEYRKKFREAFPEEYADRKFITSEMIGAAIAEFEFALTFVNAPIDEFARGNRSAMTEAQKRGAVLFFGKARCVECHSVAGNSNGMFSDFENHVIAIPQIAPGEQEFGGMVGNVVFAGPGSNEDFGLEDITRNSSDRYKFRTSPLRNIKLQPTFGHNGAWTGAKGLEGIIRHHIAPYSARIYDPKAAGVADDLQQNTGPIEPVLGRLSPRLAVPIELSDMELGDLVTFVRDGLHDPQATPSYLFKHKPDKVPSGRKMQTFE